VCSHFKLCFVSIPGRSVDTGLHMYDVPERYFLPFRLKFSSLNHNLSLYLSLLRLSNNKLLLEQAC
jgi:hypothetical protein